MRSVRFTTLASLPLVPAMALSAGPASPFPKGYEQAYTAYLAALPAEGRKLTWLTRLNEVASPARPL